MEHFKYSKIKGIEIELSTKCSIKCPQCPRTGKNNTVIPELPLVDMSFTKYKHIFRDILPQLKAIVFCGTFGDAIHNKELFKIIKLTKQHTNAYIELQTHGNARSEKWWKELAIILGDNASVSFALDGVQSNYHIYRNGGNFNKAIRNAKIFIDNGGNAKWIYIVFKHNENTINEAKNISDQLGFVDFVTKKTIRFFKHYENEMSDEIFDIEPVDKLQFVDVNGITRSISPPINENYIHPVYNTYKNKNNISCQVAKGNRTIYVGADGFVVPCGWLAGCPLPFYKNDKHLMNIIEISGGLQECNGYYKNIKEIVDIGFFKNIEQSWNITPNKKCLFMCGNSNASCLTTCERFYKNCNNN